MATSIQHDSTSVSSLAAITAGAVAAAFVIMSIGSIVTIISIGSVTSHHKHASVNLQPNTIPYVQLAAAPAGDKAHGQLKTGKTNKSHFMDAVLRENAQRMVKPSEHNVPRPAPAMKFQPVQANASPANAWTNIA